jgi:hypothetical protein
MRFKDFKFIRTGLGSYAVQIVAQHHKGGNGKKGLSQTVQLQPLRYAHNLPLDITVWLIVYFWSRGAFVIKVTFFFFFCFLVGCSILTLSSGLQRAHQIHRR